MEILIAVLTAGVINAAPMACAAIGETFSERSGVLNVGLEGMMLLGAFCGVAASGMTGNPAIGLLAAIAAGLVVALVHAFVSLTLEGDQIVSGVAINLGILGLTALLAKVVLANRHEQVVPGFAAIAIPLLSEIPIVGRVLFDQSSLVYVVYVLAIVAVILMYRTPWGLSVLAAGENPSAADSAGINVTALRYQCVLLAGALAGLGGAILALSQLRFFVDNMTQGRGFIALAAVIFGNWRPELAILGALLFGVIDALQLQLQTTGLAFPPEVMTTLPYVFTVIVLSVALGRTRMPSFLTRVYRRGEA